MLVQQKFVLGCCEVSCGLHMTLSKALTKKQNSNKKFYSGIMGKEILETLHKAQLKKNDF